MAWGVDVEPDTAELEVGLDAFEVALAVEATLEFGVSRGVGVVVERNGLGEGEGGTLGVGLDVTLGVGVREELEFVATAGVGVAAKASNNSQSIFVFQLMP